VEACGTRWTTGVGKRGYPAVMDEGRKRVLLIAAAILAARKLSQYGVRRGSPPPSAPSRTRFGRRNRFSRRLTEGGREGENPELLVKSPVFDN